VEKDERAAIAQVVENWNEGWRSKDPALASRDYAVDADWTTAFGMTRHGRDEIEDMMRQVFRSGSGNKMAREERQAGRQQFSTPHEESPAKLATPARNVPLLGTGSKNTHWSLSRGKASLIAR